MLLSSRANGPQLGTGAATALAIAVGSAGSFLVNGGALGTPSSGTVTNLTGTASININGTVGATTPTTVVGTTLTGCLVGKTINYSDGDTTPSVLNASHIFIANSGATSITDFDDAVDGQILICVFSDSNTTITRDNAYLSGGANFTSTANDILTLRYSTGAGLWTEVSRSVNA